MKRSECRSCGEPIVWCLTTNGKRMPVDFEPTEEGTFIMIGSEPGDRGERVPIVKKVQKGQEPVGELYRTHFETCEYADDHRKNRNARNGEAPHTRAYYDAYFVGAADAAKRILGHKGSLGGKTEDQVLALLRAEYKAAIGE